MFDETANFAVQLEVIGRELLALAGSAVPDPRVRQAPRRRLTHGPENHLLAELAEQLYRERRLRAAILPADLFGEPAWDMLLDLYVSTKRNRLVSVTDACLAADAPATTGLRCQQDLEQKGLIERAQDHKDRRRTFLRLTRKGEEALTSYLRSLAPR